VYRWYRTINESVRSEAEKKNRMLTSSRLDCFLRVSARDGELPEVVDIDAEDGCLGGWTGEGARS